MKLSEAVNRVIDLAGKVRDYYEAELPKRHRHYPLVEEGEEAPPPPPEEQELSEFLATLPDDIIYQLILILYLYRGRFGTDDLAGSYEGLKGIVGERDYAISELMLSVPVLAAQLSDGMEELRKQSISVDRMPLKKAKVRKQ